MLETGGTHPQRVEVDECGIEFLEFEIDEFEPEEGLGMVFAARKVVYDGLECVPRPDDRSGQIEFLAQPEGAFGGAHDRCLPPEIHQFGLYAAEPVLLAPYLLLQGREFGAGPLQQNLQIPGGILLRPGRTV